MTFSMTLFMRMVLLCVLCDTLVQGRSPYITSESTQRVDGLPLSSVAKLVDTQDERISERLFQYNSDGYLSNPTTHLKMNTFDLPNLPMSDSVPRAYSANGLLKKIPFHAPIVRQGNGFTFAYDHESHDLIAAWGPGLHLNPLNLPNDSDTFLNLISNTVGASVLRDLTKLDIPLRHLSKMSITKSSIDEEVALHLKEKPTNCSEELRFEMGVAYDVSFCALYGNSEKKAGQALISLVEHIAPAFLRSACVRPKIITLDAFCHRSDGVSNADGFREPSSLNTSQMDTAHQRALNAQSMLQFTKREWSRSVSATSSRDAAFLFTGYNDSTSLAGAAYRNGPCLLNQSFVWTEGTNPVVLAHAIGHMLGAAHSKSGIMRKNLSSMQPIEFSTATSKAFLRFLKSKIQAWCIYRNFASFGVLQMKYKWNSPLHIIDDKYNNINVSDVAIVPGATSGFLPRILSLLSEQSESSSKSIRKLSYTIHEGISCNSNGSCSISEESNLNSYRRTEIPFVFSSEAFGFGIAFSPHEYNSSGDLILSHIRPEENRAKIVYRIGYNYSQHRGAPKRWSDEQTVPEFGTKNILCAGVTVGHIRDNISNDIVDVHVQRRFAQNTVVYRVGFGLTPDGNATKGWSEGITVPGWIGYETTGVSVSVLDLNENGRPDLVLYHVDGSLGTQIAFLRVGLDLNTTGHVTGGWTEFRRIPVLYPHDTRRSGAMTVAYLGGKYPSVVSAQREATVFSADAWNLYVGTQVLTPSLIKTAEAIQVRSNQKDKCFNCYGLFQNQYCQKYSEQCKLQVDEITMKNIVKY